MLWFEFWTHFMFHSPISWLWIEETTPLFFTVVIGLGNTLHVGYDRKNFHVQ